MGIIVHDGTFLYYYAATCIAPLIPNVARIFPYSNTLEGTIVAYTCHGDTNNILAAVCSNRGIWEPNLSHICAQLQYSGTCIHHFVYLA